MGPTDTRNALVIQRVLLVLLVLVVALLLGLTVVLALVSSDVGLSLGLPLMLGTLVLGIAAASALPSARAVAANLRAHVVGVDEHRCQCAVCGTTFEPAPGSRTGPASRVAIPRERVAATRAGTRGFVVGLAIVVIGAALYYPVLGLHQQRLWLDASGGAIFQMFFIVLFAMVAVALFVTAWAGRIATRDLARAAESHDHRCRWCGRDGSTT
ncbi:MAG: hypothetical protein GX596_14215 [Propionibacterium sp.]|nr:hypothetical protein [Propionibacterium sp.]